MVVVLGETASFLEKDKVCGAPKDWNSCPLESMDSIGAVTCFSAADLGFIVTSKASNVLVLGHFCKNVKIGHLSRNVNKRRFELRLGLRARRIFQLRW